MRIVVDTNIIFSAILNTNSKIASILLYPKSKLNFYSTYQLFDELQEHKSKIKSLGKYSDLEIERVISIFSNRIRFINVALISKDLVLKAEQLAKDIDIDDTEFVALAEHAKAKLWSGDKKLIKGLIAKKREKFITTDELYQVISKKK